MSKKSKELLDNLSKITEKPQNKFQRDTFHSYTNMYYTSIPEEIHKLPKKYDKAKKKKDEEPVHYQRKFMICSCNTLVGNSLHLHEFFLLH